MSDGKQPPPSSIASTMDLGTEKDTVGGTGGGGPIKGLKPKNFIHMTLYTPPMSSQAGREPTPVKTVRRPRNRKKTPWEKRNRQSGKNTEKPYISSSLGDMSRLMMRMACMEDTLYMTEPPPVDFYDYWHIFVPPVPEVKEKLPPAYVDLRKVSVPRIRMITSSFDLMGAARKVSATGLHISEAREKKRDPYNQLTPKLSDLWKGVRMSMSNESFISSSTKVSEAWEEVLHEGGWSDDEDEIIALLSDSDDEVDEHGERAASTNPSGVHGPTVSQQGSRSIVGAQSSVQSQPKKVESDISVEAKQRQENARIAASIHNMGLGEIIAKMELAILGADRDVGIIDTFMNDLDDSFLIDSVSYGQLPDDAFTVDFDYFNEDPLYDALAREKDRLEWEREHPFKKGKKKQPKKSERIILPKI